MNRINADTDHKYRFYVAQDDLFIDLNLFQFGYEHCDPLHQFGPAVRNHFLFHYIIDGKGRLETNDHTYNLSKGQGFLLCPGQISSYFADPDDPWFYTWFEFDGLRARQSLMLAGLSEQQPVFTSDDAGSTDIPDLMLQIVNEGNESPIRLTGLAMVLLDMIVKHSQKRKQQERRPIRDFYIREAITYIESNYSKDITVEEIADRSGLNRSYFSRIFKETFGESPQKFLLKYRMIKASEMLKYTNLSIAEVASAVGYENQLHFSRAFKNIFGSSPSGFRNTHHVSLES